MHRRPPMFVLEESTKITPVKLDRAGWKMTVIDESGGYKVLRSWNQIRSAPKKLAILIGRPKAIDFVNREPRLYPEDPGEVPGLVYVLRLHLGTRTGFGPSDPDTYMPAWVEVEDKFQSKGWATAAWEFIKRMVEKYSGKKLRHSPARSSEGEAWISSLPGHLASSRHYRTHPSLMMLMEAKKPAVRGLGKHA